MLGNELALHHKPFGMMVGLLTVNIAAVSMATRHITLLQ